MGSASASTTLCGVDFRDTISTEYQAPDNRPEWENVCTDRCPFPPQTALAGRVLRKRVSRRPRRESHASAVNIPSAKVGEDLTVESTVLRQLRI